MNTKNYFFPKKLERGDVIGVIAPSSSSIEISEDVKKHGYAFLENKGFKVLEHPQCNLIEGYTAGTIEDRVNAIHEFVLNPEIKAIISFWGGKNTNQILDKLDYDLIKQNPKIFVGYSDATALLLAITKKTGLVTYTGPAMITFCKPKLLDLSWQYFEQVCILDQTSNLVKIPDQYINSLDYNQNSKEHLYQNEGLKIFKAGDGSGRIVVSNISVLQSLLGTEYFPDLRDSILFLEMGEDWDIRVFDRIMTQFFQAKIFGQIKGLIIGKFMAESKVSQSGLIEILNRVLQKYTFPVFYNFDCAHTNPIITIPNGAICEIKNGEIKLNYGEFYLT